MRTCQVTKEPYPRLGDAPMPAAGAEEASSGDGSGGSRAMPFLVTPQWEFERSSDILFTPSGGRT
jgi:hypothetical protein